ncbi:MAG: DUF1343 domain-containing protein [Spirochaetes bacterium]|nr:DUF1343 domain-containing protein [Spirochaetota bacterium]
MANFKNSINSFKKQLKNYFYNPAVFFTFLVLFISCTPVYNLDNGNSRRVYTGLERFIDDYAYKYKGKKAAVVTNQSGVDYNLKQNVSLLKEKNIEIPIVLAPEHGLYGYENEYSNENYIVDPELKVIIYNLHHLDLNALKHLLKVADFVIFDMQDMGMRCYTYVSTLKFLMDTLSGTGIDLIVFDRPNPLGFLDIKGPFLDDRFYSKNISSFPVTLLYNMTIGEAALYYKGEFRKNINLKVIPMQGYSRTMLYHETMLPWIPPSPNLPTYMSSIIYSGVVLLEGINISLGRGTPKPFEYIGAPWIEPRSFCRGLKNLNIENFNFRPVYFKPSFSKYQSEQCGGVHIIYTGGKFDPLEMSYKLISYIRNNYKEFEWETYHDSFNIDYLAGSDNFRKSITKSMPFEKMSDDIEEKSRKFRKKRNKYLIYRDAVFP